MVEFSKIMPIASVEHDCILYRQGDITVGFKLKLPEILTLSDWEYEAYWNCNGVATFE